MSILKSDQPTAGPLGEAGARLRALVATWREEIKDRAGAGCGCYGKSTMQRECANRLEAELDALLSAPVVSPPQPTCANCLHLWYAHVNSGHIGECRDVVSDGSRCGCTRFEAAAPVVSGWQPIATAPKGSWLDGPNDTRHPDYVEPPRLWLLLDDGEACVGYADAYYAAGGSGYDGGSFWVEKFSSERVKPTHWMPLPAAPVVTQEGEEPCP